MEEDTYIQNEIKKCKENPIYFIDKYMRDKDGNHVSLNAVQVMFIETILRGIGNG